MFAWKSILWLISSMMMGFLMLIAFMVYSEYGQRDKRRFNSYLFLLREVYSCLNADEGDMDVCAIDKCLKLWLSPENQVEFILVNDEGKTKWYEGKYSNDNVRKDEIFGFAIKKDIKEMKSQVYMYTDRWYILYDITRKRYSPGEHLLERKGMTVDDIRTLAANKILIAGGTKILGGTESPSEEGAKESPAGQHGDG